MSKATKVHTMDCWDGTITIKYYYDKNFRDIVIESVERKQNPQHLKRIRDEINLLLSKKQEE